MEFSEELIKETEKLVAGKPYPLYVKAFKAIGVTGYEVIVSNLNRTFKNSYGRVVFIAGVSESTAPAANFNLQQVKTAVIRTQQRITNYPEFIKEIAAGGVHSYFADFSTMKITYEGKDVSNSYSEEIPRV